MRILRRCSYLAAALTLVTLGLAGGALADKHSKVIIGLPVESIDFLPVFVAVEKGYFKEVGIEPEIILLKGRGDTARALASGDINVGALGLGHASALRGSGVPAIYISAFNTSVAFSLVARKDAKVASVKELRGKTIGVTGAGSLTHATAEWAVKQVGLDPKKDLSIIPTGGGGELLAALKSGKVDAVMLFEPHVATVLRDGTAVELLDLAKVLKNFIPNGFTVTEKWARENPRVVESLHAAILKALAFINKDKAGTLALTRAKLRAMSPEAVQAGLDHMYPTFSKDSKIAPEDARVTQEVLLGAGIIKQVFPYDQLVHPIARVR